MPRGQSDERPGRWRCYNDRIDEAENFNREAIWQQNRDQGDLRAAFEARDLIDFGAHGAWPAIRMPIDIVPLLKCERWNDVAGNVVTCTGDYFSRRDFVYRCLTAIPSRNSAPHRSRGAFTAAAIASMMAGMPKKRTISQPWAFCHSIGTPIVASNPSTPSVEAPTRPG
jgi:hypothetical protein